MMDTNLPQAANPAKLFVGNLSYQMTSDDLRAAFSEFGEVVDCIVMTDKFSGRSKGFGFVTFATAEEATAAVDGLNGKEVQERQIFVSVARPPQPRENRGGFNRDSRGGGSFNRDNRGGGGRGGFSRGGNRNDSNDSY